MRIDRLFSEDRGFDVDKSGWPMVMRIITAGLFAIPDPVPGAASLESWDHVNKAAFFPPRTRISIREGVAVEWENLAPDRMAAIRGAWGAWR